MSAGIYIHLPFCKSRCIYCAFYSQTKYIDSDCYVNCLIEEAKQNVDFLTDNNIETIYIGGGTPSSIHPRLIIALLSQIYEIFNVNNCIEVTIEVNPDDINDEWIKQIKENTPINRISIGVQSFNDKELRLINRRHDGENAKKAIYLISSNFQNFSLDLIYGLPMQNMQSWINNISIALTFNPKHISAYNISVEANTPITKLIEENKITIPNEDFQIECYYELIQVLRSHKYIHYEISNYCLPNYKSIHNSHYWKDYQYLGLGASAHSYNGNVRKWNVSSIEKYIWGIKNNYTIYEYENIDIQKKYNEYIILHLRTNEGINFEKINQIFGSDLLSHTKDILKFIDKKFLINDNNNVILNDYGFLFADGIATNFLI